MASAVNSAMFGAEHTSEAVVAAKMQLLVVSLALCTCGALHAPKNIGPYDFGALGVEPRDGETLRINFGDELNCLATGECPVDESLLELRIAEAAAVEAARAK
ncbi:hypothetical protein M885DRAFT_616725 [Pelagophyceae sp. CCMP2097]|nr:hypothetical protein M885DRAFT_616725 [Pelagophyceae sp. CCMP2097]